MRKRRILLLGCLSLAGAATAHASDPVPGAVPAQGPQLMLYFRQPLGRIPGPRVYGLRLERTSVVSGPAANSSTGPLRRREILDFEFAPHGEMHMALGRRLFYDVGRNEFGLAPAHSSITLSLATPAALTLNPVSASAHPMLGRVTPSISGTPGSPR